jgi:hypothetical protein
MRARLLGGLLLVLLLTATAVVQSQDFTYTTNSGTITITGSGCGSVACLVGAVSIPSVINGLPVVSIGSDAFFPDYLLTQVTLPDTITLIGSGAFWACGLTSIVIPPGVTNIGPAAFSQCSSLVSVTIPNGVQNIEFSTFFECSSLTNITIPSGVISIGESAFDGCGRLSNVTIPSSLTNIGGEAFFMCSNLASIFFKGNAPTLGESVFLYDSIATVYYLPATKGWGPTFGGAPTRLWNPQALTNDAGFGVRQNRFGFNIGGTADIPLVIEATTNLAAQSWVALQSSTLTNGFMYFSDPQWTNFPGRVYRIRAP